MKHKSLFVLAGAVLLLASCGGTPGSEGSSSKSGSSESSSSKSSKSSSSRESSSSTSSSSRSVPTEASLPDLPAKEGTNVTYIDHLGSGGESLAKQNAGGFYVWAGDGGRNDGLYFDQGDIVVEYATGWAWYGVQVFYEPTYAQVGDVYNIRIALHSDVEGSITMNGEVFNLVWGWNVLEQERTVTAANTTVSMQLGLVSGEVMMGAVMRFRSIEIYDKTNTYHETKFVNGEEVLKDIQVRDGQKVSAPSVTVPEGKLLSGWFDENENKFDATQPVTAAHTYRAVFVDKSEITTRVVTYKLGDRVIYTEEVADGALAEFDATKTPFGYKLDGLFTDAALTTPYAGAITEDTTIYLKATVTPSTYLHGGDMGPHISHGDNGEFVFTFPEHGYDTGWHIQINFEPLPVGEYGETITFSYEYRLQCNPETPGVARAYGGGNTLAESEVNLPAVASWTKISYTYEGGMIPGDTKFTNELGTVHPVDAESNLVFEIRNPLIEVTK